MKCRQAVKEVRQVAKLASFVVDVLTGDEETPVIRMHRYSWIDCIPLRFDIHDVTIHTSHAYNANGVVAVICNQLKPKDPKRVIQKLVLSGWTFFDEDTKESNYGIDMLLKY